MAPALHQGGGGLLALALPAMSSDSEATERARGGGVVAIF
jgi:hypothetical protein